MRYALALFNLVFRNSGIWARVVCNIRGGFVAGERDEISGVSGLK